MQDSKDNSVLKLTTDNFNDTIKNGVTLVDFWAEWCGPCKMLGPVYEQISNEAKYDGKLKFAKLSTEEQPDLAAKFNISGIPCLIVTKQGKEIDRVVGFAPKETLKEKIDAILSKI